MKRLAGSLIFIFVAFVVLSRAASIAPSTLADDLLRDIARITPFR